MEASRYAVITLVALAVAGVALAARPDYVKPCEKNPAPERETTCVVDALKHLRPFLARGIPEIQIPPVEPYRVDLLSLSLTSGPQGYRITLKDMDIFGLTNYTVPKLKLSRNGTPFEGVFSIPRLTMSADYKSSGVLLILPASGSGVLHNTMRDVTMSFRGTISFHKKKIGEIMKLDTLQVDVDCKSLSMKIEKAFEHQPILREATNLFLRENGKEVYSAMKPELNTKLAVKFRDTANTLLKHTPVEYFYTD